jgi:heat shock protein HslJ
VERDRKDEAGRRIAMRRAWMTAALCVTVVSSLAACRAKPDPTNETEMQTGTRPGSGASRAELIGTYWKIVSVDGEDVTVGSYMKEPYLILKAKDRALQSSTGINQMSGSYELPGGAGGGSIKIRPGPMTMMAGPEPMMKQEQRVLEWLRQVDGYLLEGQQLTLSAQGRDVMVLRAGYRK